jgi:hypothetical protein
MLQYNILVIKICPYESHCDPGLFIINFNYRAVVPSVGNGKSVTEGGLFLYFPISFVSLYLFKYISNSHTCSIDKIYLAFYSGKSSY